MDRYKAIIYAGAVVLGWAGGIMLASDHLVINFFHPNLWQARSAGLFCTALVIIVPLLIRKHPFETS